MGSTVNFGIAESYPSDPAPNLWPMGSAIAIESKHLAIAMVVELTTLPRASFAMANSNGSVMGVTKANRDYEIIPKVSTTLPT